MTDPWKVAFAQFLDAASPYLDEIVIAGGWASRLHRLSPHALEPGFAPLLTSDVDTATPSVLPKREQTLGERMIRYGFVDTHLREQFFTPKDTSPTHLLA